MANKRNRESHPTLQELRQEMTAVGQALKDAYARFDYADDPDLIDACIYEINALKARYNYIMRCVKERSGAPAAPVLPTEPEAAVAASGMEGGGACLS